MMTEPQDKARQCWDPLNKIAGAPSHAQEEQPKFDIGAALVSACEAIAGDTVLLSAFCEQLTAAVCNEKTLDAAQTEIVEAWKERAG